MRRWSQALGSEVDPSAIEAGWEHVRRRRDRLRAVRRAVRAAPIGVLVVALLLVARAWLVPRPHVDVALTPIALSGGAPLPAEWAPLEPLVVGLDDGSRLEIAAATRLRTRPSAPERVDLTLERGRVTFDVKPNGPRAWVIDAGSVEVSVLGTRFTVARDDDAVDVAVERGKVRVASREGVHILVAGESFTQRPPRREPLANARPVEHVEQVDSAPKTHAAIRVDAMMHADSLRRAGRADDAVAVLRGVVDGGGAHERRALAAFTIGKIEAEDRGDTRAAARWFERAIALGLPSGLDEEGHARAVECWARAGAKPEAAQAAARYERLFPTGRHRVQVEEWAPD